MRTYIKKLALAAVAVLGLTSAASAFKFSEPPEYKVVPESFTGEEWAAATTESWIRTKNTVWDQCGGVIASYQSVESVTLSKMIICLEEVAVRNDRTRSSLSNLQIGEPIILPLTRWQVAAYEHRVVASIDLSGLDAKLAALRDEFASDVSGVHELASAAKQQAELAFLRIKGLSDDVSDLKDRAMKSEQATQRTSQQLRDLQQKVDGKADVSVVDELTTRVGRLEVGGGTSVVPAAVTVFGYAFPWWWLLLGVVVVACIILIWLLVGQQRTKKKSGRTTSGREILAKQEARVNRLEGQVKRSENDTHRVEGKADEALKRAEGAHHLARQALNFEGFVLLEGPATQSELELALLGDGDSVTYKLVPDDDPNDIREIRFTRKNNAFGDGRPGLEIDGITNQRQPIAMSINVIFSKFRKAGRGNILKGVNNKKSLKAAE